MSSYHKRSNKTTVYKYLVSI